MFNPVYLHKGSVAYSNQLVVGAPNLGKTISLRFLSCYNSGATQFLQIHDSLAAAAEGAIPIMVKNLPAAAQMLDLDITFLGYHFVNGLYICNSTTGPTKTIGAANCWFNCFYLPTE